MVRGFFPATRHSVIERLRSGTPDGRRHAFGEVVEAYWKPLYKHLRVTWRLAPDDASDATQAFFAEAFEKGWLERFDPRQAHFRTFVRMCADRLMMNRRQSEGRLKRGGSFVAVPLDFDGAERELSAGGAPAADPDERFHREFVRALLGRAVQALRADYTARGRDLQIVLFERYDLAPADDVSYASLAAEFGLTPSQVTNHLAQARRSFRRHALDALRAACGSDEEFEREARELFGSSHP